jgi:hypothetical protein
MTTAALLLVLLAAPLVYFLVGYPLAAGLRRPRLALVAGLGLTGWACEFILMAGVPVGVPLAGLAGLAGLGWYRVRRSEVRACLREVYLVYSWPLAAVLLTPFPGMGPWSMDWLYVFQSGQAVMGNLPYGGPMLERPPLGGASCIPLWLIADGLPTFQVWSAVTSAALVLVGMELYRELGGTRGGVRVWLPLLAGCFFLHHTMLGWAKFLAAGLTLSGVLLMCRAESGRWNWTAGSALFALSVATHQSAILYGPCVILFGLSAGLRRGVRRLSVALAAGLVFVLPFEVWTIRTFGLDAKVKANPAMAQRNPDESAGLRAGFMLLSTFVPWNTIEDVARCLSGAPVAPGLYWLVTGVLTALAGTLLGSMVPFLPLRRGPPAPRQWASVLTSRGPVACLALAVVGNALLSPYFAKWGSAQTGVVPVQVLLFVVLIRWLDDASEGIQKRVNGLALALGIVPYALLAVGVTVWLRTGPAAHDAFLTWDDNDYETVFAQADGRSLAFALFPAGPLLATGLYLVPWLVRDKS